MSNARVAVSYETPELLAQATELAQALGLSLSAQQDHQFEFYLLVTPARLELQQARQTTARPPAGPVYVDFVSGKAAHRRRFGGGRRQTIAKAVGIRPGIKPSVIDATAGLGYDAFVLASLGCRVTMLERSPIVAVLLQDALKRARNDAELGRWIDQRLNLIVTDGCAYMLEQAPQADVVYLDPMYPQRSKTALVKNNMQQLQRLLGEDQDAARLLITALDCARQRVVVKRPRAAAPLNPGPAPDRCIVSKTTRFDIYHLSRYKTNRVGPFDNAE